MNGIDQLYAAIAGYDPDRRKRARSSIFDVHQAMQRNADVMPDTGEASAAEQLARELARIQLAESGAMRQTMFNSRLGEASAAAEDRRRRDYRDSDPLLPMQRHALQAQMDRDQRDADPENQMNVAKREALQAEIDSRRAETDATRAATRRALDNPATNEMQTAIRESVIKQSMEAGDPASAMEIARGGSPLDAQHIADQAVAQAKSAAESTLAEIAQQTPLNSPEGQTAARQAIARMMREAHDRYGGRTAQKVALTLSQMLSQRLQRASAPPTLTPASERIGQMFSS